LCFVPLEQEQGYTKLSVVCNSGGSRTLPYHQRICCDCGAIEFDIATELYLIERFGRVTNADEGLRSRSVQLNQD